MNNLSDVTRFKCRLTVSQKNFPSSMAGVDLHILVWVHPNPLSFEILIERLYKKLEMSPLIKSGVNL
ncbi:hypothetical protein HanXRQr2_Chr09g0407541 [Helianthus annuus]|uniref:Uncharacterized protein n=1 Tax=Helianthus annuus TaxID=4232 RepID=A0A9K3I8R9_HELAN|nr:hypothetical protein HanXRQr2_Chr09g0407541 [Helianthus annuus]KAJ0894833.1 hypothetical protein HanPSC8_Chr09g0393421 [Helianthus annuus]